jgi:hypothetical protein
MNSNDKEILQRFLNKSEDTGFKINEFCEKKFKYILSKLCLFLCCIGYGFIKFGSSLFGKNKEYYNII